ncbi:MAG: hypothetical protein M5R36_14975 [Deltaproteobacteria bacterium]|nr:hypothetical protein [Deltaproteobacteria bacterium]
MYNGGEDGASLPQLREKVRILLPTIKPSLVIFYGAFNDKYEGYWGFSAEQIHAISRRVAELAVGEAPPPRFHERLKRRARWTLVNSQTVNLPRDETWLYVGRKADHNFNQRHGPTLPLERFEALLDEMREEISRAGASLVLALEATTFDLDDFGAAMRRVAEKAGGAVSRPDARLRGLLAGLRDALRGHGSSHLGREPVPRRISGGSSGGRGHDRRAGIMTGHVRIAVFRATAGAVFGAALAAAILALPAAIPLDNVHQRWAESTDGPARDVLACYLFRATSKMTERHLDNPYLLPALSALRRRGEHAEFRALAKEALAEPGGRPVIRRFVERMVAVETGP